MKLYGSADCSDFGVSNKKTTAQSSNDKQSLLERLGGPVSESVVEYMHPGSACLLEQHFFKPWIEQTLNLI